MQENKLNFYGVNKQAMESVKNETKTTLICKFFQLKTLTINIVKYLFETSAQLYRNILCAPQGNQPKIKPGQPIQIVITVQCVFMEVLVLWVDLEFDFKKSIVNYFFKLVSEHSV